MNFDKPLPTPTPTSAPFWEGLAHGTVKLQRCADCGAWVFYPRNRCPGCLSDSLTWHEVPGTGSLYTFTIARQPTAPHFSDEVPQRLAVVELDEGVRMTSTLVNVTDEQIEIGMRLRPYFDRVTDDVTLLRFQPA
jgi:uncharacterized OB-fold protein